MKSLLETAKTGIDRIDALNQTLIFLSELTITRTQEELEFSEWGREGLGNLFYMLARECERTLEMMEQEGKAKKGASHE